MKKVVLTIIIFSFAIITIACQKANPVENATVTMTASLASIQQSVTLLPKEPLEEAELARILFIRKNPKKIESSVNDQRTMKRCYKFYPPIPPILNANRL